MPYGYRIELNGTDISERVRRFEITCAMDSYVRELSLDIADEDLFDTIDFGQLPETTALEVFTRVDTDWVSRGRFFIEKPTYSVDLHATTTGLWGRSETAGLGPPFAVKISKTWEKDTTFFAICEELCTAAGLTWDSAQSAIQDFIIYAFTYQAENAYPSEIISEILELAHGPDAYLSTDRSGRVCIRKLVRFPSAADCTVTDPITVSAREEPEFPDFANRIKISATGALAGYGITLWAPGECMQADGSSQLKLYARVADQDGLAVQQVPVAWTAESNFVTLDQPASNTQTVTIRDEEKRAKSWYEVEVEFPPKTVSGIWAYKDIGKTENLIDDGYEIDDRTIHLAKKLKFCDQLLKISYTVEGVAVNYCTAKTYPGTEKITADLAGNRDSKEIYLDNPCKCPPAITLRANPSSIKVGESARILAYLEIGGAAVTDGRSVYMSIVSSSSHGRLTWTKNSLGSTTVDGEEAQTVNEISGITQCAISMYPKSVTGVWVAGEDTGGNRIKTGSNIYSSHSGKIINLQHELPTNTDLLVDYVALGAVVNIYDGLVAGTEKIRGYITTTREAPTESEVSITVSKDEGDDDDDGNEGLCDVGFTSCGEAGVICTSGQVYGKKGGVDGCWPAGEADACGDGKVYCYKQGSLSCYPVAECDTSYKTPKIHGQKSGAEGCYLATELDTCGTAGHVYCFKGNLLGCYSVAECDKGTGAGEPVECEAGTTCCTNKETKIKGCWPTEQCEEGGDGGDGGGKPKPPWDPKPGGDCHIKEDKVVKCKKGEACCNKQGVRGCYPWRECDVPPDYCYTTDCRKTPTPECIASRFANGIKDGGDGCSCEEMCDKEFSALGTTQNYDGSSFLSVGEIVKRDYGYTVGSPAFWEKYEELKEDAIDSCRRQCGDCAASKLTLSGSDAVTKPGGYQFSVGGGLGNLQWSVSGTGATISDSGYVTLDETACGAFTVSVTDECGSTVTMDARVANAGAWVVIATVPYPCFPWQGYPCGSEMVPYQPKISGKRKISVSSATSHTACASNIGDVTALYNSGGCAQYVPLIVTAVDGSAIGCGSEQGYIYCAAMDVTVYEWRCS